MRRCISEVIASLTIKILCESERNFSKREVKSKFRASDAYRSLATRVTHSNLRYVPR